MGKLLVVEILGQRVQEKSLSIMNTGGPDSVELNSGRAIIRCAHHVRAINRSPVWCSVCYPARAPLPMVSVE